MGPSDYGHPPGSRRAEAACLIRQRLLGHATSRHRVHVRVAGGRGRVFRPQGDQQDPVGRAAGMGHQRPHQGAEAAGGLPQGRRRRPGAMTLPDDGDYETLCRAAGSASPGARQAATRPGCAGPVCRGRCGATASCPRTAPTSGRRGRCSHEEPTQMPVADGQASCQLLFGDRPVRPARSGAAPSRPAWLGASQVAGPGRVSERQRRHGLEAGPWPDRRDRSGGDFCPELVR